MPHLHPDGRAVQGTTSVSVNGVVPGVLSGVTAGNPHWLLNAANTVVYQNVTAGSILQSIDLDTSVLTTQSSIGANELGAGGNVWLAWVAAGGNKGIRTNVTTFPGWTSVDTPVFPLAGPGDVDSNGRSAFVQNYQAGRGMQAYSALGALVSTWDVQLAAGYVINCRTGLVAYPASGRVWHLRSLTTGLEVPLANRTETIFNMVPLVCSQGTLVLEVSERLTLRFATASQGYVLTEDDSFKPDLCEISPGVIRIAYSATAGEGPTALRVIDLTLGTGATSLGTTASGSLVFTAGPNLGSGTSALPASGVSGGTGVGHLQVLLNHPFVKPDRVLTKEWQKTLWQLFLNNAQPVNLATGVTGILPEANGGTGTESGNTVINGGDILEGTTPLTALQSQAASTLVGRGSASAGSPEVITLGTGLAMTGTVLSATDVGSWIPLVDGSEPPVFITDGAGHLITVAYAP